MLTNTVGIIVFILIFTVLTAGGVVLAKRLPMEHETSAEPMHFVCLGGRIMPINDDLTEDFVKPLGKPTSYYQVDAWIGRFNARRMEDDYFVLTGEGEVERFDLGFYKSASLDLTVVFTPKENAGETVQQLKSDGSRFRQTLRAGAGKNRFVHFMVSPDSLEVFDTARAIAIAEMSFGTGWRPMNEDKRIRFNLTGRGSKAAEQ
jgi:hypothetical protein